MNVMIDILLTILIVIVIVAYFLALNWSLGKIWNWIERRASTKHATIIFCSTALIVLTVAVYFWGLPTIR